MRKLADKSRPFFQYPIIAPSSGVCGLYVLNKKDRNVLVYRDSKWIWILKEVVRWRLPQRRKGTSFLSDKTLQAAAFTLYNQPFQKDEEKLPIFHKMRKNRQLLARQKGIRTPDLPLGVDPIRWNQVQHSARKSLEIQGFSLFQILSGITLHKHFHRDFTPSNWLEISKAFDFRWTLQVQANSSM